MRPVKSVKPSPRYVGSMADDKVTSVPQIRAEQVANAVSFLENPSVLTLAVLTFLHSCFYAFYVSSCVIRTRAWNMFLHFPCLIVLNLQSSFCDVHCFGTRTIKNWRLSVNIFIMRPTCAQVESLASMIPCLVFFKLPCIFFFVSPSSRSFAVGMR